MELLIMIFIGAIEVMTCRIPSRVSRMSPTSLGPIRLTNS